MTAWFGKDWGAPACDPEEHVATPVGRQCCYCDKTIKADDQGFVVPGVTQQGFTHVIYHLDCMLRSVMPCPGCPKCQPEKWS